MSNLYKIVYTYTKSRWLELCHTLRESTAGLRFDRIDATKLLITSTKIIYYDIEHSIGYTESQQTVGNFVRIVTKNYDNPIEGFILSGLGI